MKAAPSSLASPAMAALTFLLLILLPAPLQAQTWVTNQSGDYSDATNWLGGVAPGTSSNVFFVNPDLAVTSTVTFTVNTTNGNATFNRGVFVLDMGGNTWALDNIEGFSVGRLNTLGASADVTINGGVVRKTNAGFFIGVSSADRESVLRLTNGATFSLPQATAALVGRQGSSNQLIVSDGSSFSADGMHIGGLAGANANTTLVAGINSEMSLRNRLVVNADQLTTNNRLVISNGGTVIVINASAALARVFVGGQVLGGTHNTDGGEIVITGTNSRLETTGDFIAVNTGTNTVVGNRFSVENSGLLQATNASMEVTSADTNGYRPSKFVVDGGMANLKGIQIRNNAFDMLSGNVNLSDVLRTAGLTNVINFAGGTIETARTDFGVGSLTVGDGDASVVANYVLTGGNNHGVGTMLTVASDGTVRGHGVVARFNTGLGATAVVNSGTISAGAGQTLRVVGSLTNQSGALLRVTNGGAFIVSALSTNAGAVNIDSGSSATFSNGLSGVGPVTNNGTLAIGASGGSSTISGVISGAGELNKLGAGTLTLNAANTYRGNTTVGSGTLVVATNGALAFTIGGSGTNNALLGPGTTAINGSFVFNLSTASTNTNSTWTIVANTLANTYGTNFFVSGFTGVSGGSWTNTTNGVSYVFSQPTGELTVQAGGGVIPYDAWVAYWQGVDPSFTSTAGSADSDGDRFNNSLEFAFGGDPTVGTSAFLTAIKAGTNALFRYVARNSGVTYTIDSRTNLASGSWTNAAVTVTNSTDTNNINIPADYTRKEFTVPATGNAFYRVQAVIASLPEVPPLPGLNFAPGVSVKSNSVTVTAQMRSNAIANRTNVASPWAADRVLGLQQKLTNYLAASDQFLWNMLPVPTMPRSIDCNNALRANPPYTNWNVNLYTPVEVGPPGVTYSNHTSVPMALSGGWGTVFYYDIDPFNHPWKVQCRGSGERYPKNDFASFYQSALDANGNFNPSIGSNQFLIPEGPPGAGPWVVDNGYGANFGTNTFLFAAHYAFRVWQQAIDVVLDLSELYTITGDPAPAHKAGVLLARMAAFYPSMRYAPDPADTNAAPLTGGVMDHIWETMTAERLSLGYDRIFDHLVTNQNLANFVASHQSPGQPMTPRHVAGAIETGLLREFAARIKQVRIRGNMGHHQSAMTAVAIALDNGAETTEMLDWVFHPRGGKLPSVLLDELSRDGHGLESGLGYSSIAPREFFKLQGLLATYPSYPQSDLFASYPKFRNSLAAGERARLNIGPVANVGDGGKAMGWDEWGTPATIEMAFKGFLLDGEADSRREMFFATLGNPIRLPRDIYAVNPGADLQAATEAITALATNYATNPAARIRPSFVSGGYGLAALQSAGANPRTLAVNFGPMGWGHGHGDRLGLHIFSHQLQMATDLGYPGLATANPERIGWTSHVASHNTVMVDDQQMGVWSSFSGKVRLFAGVGPVQVMDIDGGGERTMRGLGHSVGRSGFFPMAQWTNSEARRFYPQVSTYRRCVTMVDVNSTNSYYLDLFWVRGGHTHRLVQNGGGPMVTSDWPHWSTQTNGTLAGEGVAFGQMADPVTWTNAGSGLSWLKNVKRAAPDLPFWVDWNIVEPHRTNLPTPLNAHLRVHNLSQLDEAATATGVVPSTSFPLAQLRYLVRTVSASRDAATQFVSVIEPYGTTPFIESVRLLESAPPAGQFGAAVEVTLADGRVDRILVTEEGGTLTAEDLEIDGRVAWVRTGIGGAVADWALIDASQLVVAGQIFASNGPAAYTGEITSINESDPLNVIIGTGLDDLPRNLAGQYVLVDNHQRADASYLIKAVLAGGRLNIGAAALDEIHQDPFDYSKGVLKNITRGDPLRIANPVRAPGGSR